MLVKKRQNAWGHVTGHLMNWTAPCTTIIFTRSSDLAKLSSCTGVSEARLDLFAHKQRAYDSIPPTSGALKEHVKRPAFQAGHIWNQSTVCNPQLPSPGDWGWTKVDGTWVPHWTELAAVAKSCQELTRCGCKVHCSGRCRCFKAGLSCTALCECTCQNNWIYWNFTDTKCFFRF